MGPLLTGVVNSPTDLPEFLRLQGLSRVRRFLLSDVLSFVKLFDTPSLIGTLKTSIWNGSGESLGTSDSS